jgi:GTP-binding protein HflX
VKNINGKDVPRALVVGLKIKSKKKSLKSKLDLEFENSLGEIERLLDTLGIEVHSRFVQVREAPSAGTYLGQGKVAELADFCSENDIDLVAVDVELSSAQARNLERLLGVEVYDRTEIILEIFSAHAGCGVTLIDKRVVLG